MRIALLGQKGFPGSWGGVEAHVEAVAVRLAERGHEVTAYVRRWWQAGAGERHRGVGIRRVPGIRTRHLDAASHSAVAALDAALRGHDVVHVHGIGPALFAVLPRLARRRVVATVHALDYRSDKWGPLARAALRLGERSALRVAHRTLVVSRGLQAFYAERGHRTDYVPNGVDPAGPAAPDWITRTLGLAGGDYWLFLGRWVPGKGLVELVTGYRRLPEPRPRLVLAGADPDGGAVERAVAAACAGCPGVVRPGLVGGEPKAELLANALAVVSAATQEGLPIALLEAMSHGRPCIASDIPGHREAAGDSAAALLAPMRTADEVTAALARFQGLSADTRAAMGRAGRARVAAEYTWDRVVDRLEAIYREVAGPPAMARLRAPRGRPT
jgi:glycosyltransferase involved in cell wall biosynthesis